MLKAHPVAAIFPMMTDGEFAAFRDDIKANGQHEPIVICDGLILDGRNRAKACADLGVEPRVIEWDHVGTAQAFVISANLRRHHLNDAQRAMIAARLSSAPDPKGRNGGDSLFNPISVEAAGKLLNVGRTSVVAARRILREGTREEIEGITNGTAGVQTIAQQLGKGLSPRVRDKARRETWHTRGNRADSLQRVRMHAEVWAHVSGALDALTNLPLPADVAKIIAAQPLRKRAVNEKLSRSLQWLKDFSDVWTRDHATPPAPAHAQAEPKDAASDGEGGQRKHGAESRDRHAGNGNGTS